MERDEEEIEGAATMASSSCIQGTHWRLLMEIVDGEMQRELGVEASREREWEEILDAKFVMSLLWFVTNLVKGD